MSRITAAVLAVALAGCAIPQQNLDSLLASQGIASSSQVSQSRRGPFEANWLVVVRDELRQIAPMICTTHERYFDVRESPGGLRIERTFVHQEFALVDCANVTETNLHEVSSNRDLDDQALVKFLAPLTALPRIMSAQDQTVRFHYDGEYDITRLRRFLSQMELNRINSVSIIPLRQHTVFSIQIGDDHFSVTFAFDDNGLTDITVEDTILIY